MKVLAGVRGLGGGGEWGSRDREPGSLFPAVSSLHFETQTKLANLLKHWSLETRSGQETSLKFGIFFNSHVPSVVVNSSFITKACR